MIDFTIYRQPVLALPCPDCGRKVGVMCRSPSGHKAANFHTGRRLEADRQFIEQHGASASIERTENGWWIDPEGRTHAGRSP